MMLAGGGFGGGVRHSPGSGCGDLLPSPSGRFRFRGGKGTGCKWPCCVCQVVQRSVTSPAAWVSDCLERECRGGGCSDAFSPQPFPSESGASSSTFTLAGAIFLLPVKAPSVCLMGPGGLMGWGAGYDRTSSQPGVWSQ